MQKTYTPDFMTGKQEANNGEIAMYLVENAYEAIMEKEIFDAVQRRKNFDKNSNKDSNKDI